MRRLLSYILAVLALSACTSTLERELSGSRPSLDGQPVTITFSVPDVRLGQATKSLEDGDGLISGEPYLDPDKLYILVCGHSQSIKYIRKAELVTDGAGNPVTSQVPVADIPDYPISDGSVSTATLYTFKVQLELSDQDRTIHFLGNVDESKLITGSYSYQILPTLLSYEGRQAYWQKVYMPSISPLLDSEDHPVKENDSYLPDKDTRERLSYIPLIRNYAKILVTDATAPEDGFELFSYAVIYYPKNGSVVPYRSNVSIKDDPFNFNLPSSSNRFSGYERCNFPTLESTLGYQGNLISGVEFDKEIPTDAMFRNPDISGGRVIRYDKENPEQGFYLYERGIPNDRMEPTYVIIRGRFGDDEDYYYYRLDLMETKVVNFESVYQYYPIYRNFRYNIQLNRISSVGVSTPELAANSSGAEDISADISMRHLSDISNGKSRLVVEPFMSKTYTGPSEDGYYYIYARFFNDLNSPDPNVDWGAVTVELEPMEDMSENILVLYDDVGNEVQGFYPSAQEMGGVPGFRVIRFNTTVAGAVTKTQKIKITGRNLYAMEEFPLYREVEISLQRRQDLTVTCRYPEISLYKGAKQEIQVTIPADLPSSMFPLDFTIEAENTSLTPDNDVTGNNLPVISGISISDNEGFDGRQTIQFVRTLTLDEYRSLTVKDGKCTFSSHFKSNRSNSETTVWVSNEFFNKGSASFTNAREPEGHFYILADPQEADGCYVRIDMSNLQYRIDDESWQNYTSATPIPLSRGHKVSFRSTKTITNWNSSNNGKNRKFFCYAAGSKNTDMDGKFSVGGNIASLIVGDNYTTEGASFASSYSFVDLFHGHKNLTDASQLVLPMLKCSGSSYKSMFQDCTGLKRAPELPALTLADQCYRNMFMGCTSLEEAPYLPAEGVSGGCYQRMFTGCTSLRLIKLNSKTYTSTAFRKSGEENWIQGVAAQGEIWLNPAIKKSKNFENIIPTGWTVRQLPDGELWTY